MASLPDTSRDPEVDPLRLRRTRSLTVFGLEQFQQKVTSFVSRLARLKRSIDSILTDIDINPISDLGTASDISADLSQLSNKYEALSKEYISFLLRSQSEESTRLLQEHNLVSRPLRASISGTLQKLTLIRKPKNGKSLSSAGSDMTSIAQGSRSSAHLATVIAQHAARAEAAKVKLKYAKEESAISEQLATMQARKRTLQLKRDYDVAESKLAAIKQAMSFSNLESPNAVFNQNFDYYADDSDNNSDTGQPVSSIKEYVKQVNANRYDDLPSKSYSSHHSSAHVHNDNPAGSMQDKPLDHCVYANNLMYDMPYNRDDSPPIQVLDPKAPVFEPKTDSTGNIQSRELAKFLVKKDLLTSRLVTFDDNPTHYPYWKVSFKNIMDELDASPLEHLDLLIKSLGPSSKKQAVNIRSANGHDLKSAIKFIWERLDDRYGSPEMIESALKKRIQKFPRLTESSREELFELSDLVAEIESVKSDSKFSTLFAYFDSSTGVNLIVEKFQEKWTNEANTYKRSHQVTYPPFSFFSSFLHRIARIRNDPGFIYERPTYQRNNQDKQSQGRGQNVSVRKTEVDQKENKGVLCPIHNTGHSLNMCRAFRSQPLVDRQKFVKEKGFCFKCCGPVKHHKKKCRETVKCNVCKSGNHPTALHPDNPPLTTDSHEGEKEKTEVKSSCTQICNTKTNTSKSCAKIVLVNVYPQDQKHLLRRVYCMLDDQSNRTLAVSDLFNKFGDNSAEKEYMLSSCAGKFVTAGRRATGYVVESLDETCSLNLPEVIECNDIPNNHEEIPSPTVAEAYPHLHDISHLIPPIDHRANVELLIGRDCIKAHHVLDHRIGPNGLPYAQRLTLGWVVIGNVCLGKVHEPEHVNVNKVNVLTNGRPTLLESCDSNIHMTEDPIFHKAKGDEKTGLSIEDKVFLDIMGSGMKKGDDGRWHAPLPFRNNRQVLRDNRPLAIHRARSLDISIQQNHVKRDHVIKFMTKLLENEHAELAPDIPFSKERWYLPLFGIYHPIKPEKIRMVFDSLAKYQNVSLNQVLLKGPDLCNSLLGILLRFRREAIAMTMDIEQMFYNFKVTEDNRDFLRFLWHADNDLTKPLVDYRMTVHVFGNTTSPSIATYGLRKSIENAEPDIIDLVSQNFYVDDGLLSCSDAEQSIDLVHRTKHALYDGGRLRLHKFASNSRKVLDSFDQCDLASDYKNLDLGDATLPMQRSLGLLWDTQNDVFTFRVSSDSKPFTKRGVLSTINSIYDPLGFVAPVVIKGKLLLRDGLACAQKLDWDEPLPDRLSKEWNLWVTSLSELETLRIQRNYSDVSFATADKREVHIFADASKDAIGAVAYLKLYSEDSVTVSFLLGKAKVAPPGGLTIPRLELCAAVLSVELADTIKDQLDGLHSDLFHFYLDSQIVLGYISNESRRFYVYVANRVSRIRQSCSPTQWSYVPSNQNPADLATRSIHSADLVDSMWLKGPDFLYNEVHTSFAEPTMALDDQDVEVRPEVKCCQTQIFEQVKLGCELLNYFSDWRSLVRFVALLKYVARRKANKLTLPKDPNDPDFLKEVERFIIRVVQVDAFSKDIGAIANQDPLPSSSSLLNLSPTLDSYGLLRVGGRLSQVQDPNVINDTSRHPIILPKNSHVSTLIIRFCHHKVSHQGRHFTEGALRSAGYWVIGGKRLISSEISKCVTCRKLRGPLGSQLMSDLPVDRLTPASPFSYVGVDTFGPWAVEHRRTRGGLANQKRWALLFTCLVTRAIHIEVIEEMSSSSFINALRRLIAIRGQVKQFRSDRGTNFVGATEDLSISAEFFEKGPLGSFLTKSGIKWIFNPTHASHMGGAWERLIGVSRKILDSLLLQHGKRGLTHEVLVTFMAEVCAIVNNRPLLPVSSDPECPSILTPASLLTMKPNPDVEPFRPFNSKEMILSHWKRVQGLAEEFWHRWKTEYLHSLQTRRKWTNECKDLKEGDIVLMKDQDSARNDWPMGIVKQTFPSADGKVRKVEVAVTKDNKLVRYVRPVSQLVSLIEV